MLAASPVSYDDKMTIFVHNFRQSQIGWITVDQWSDTMPFSMASMLV